MFVFGLLIGLAVGGVIVGVVANRRPLWFAHVVTAANAVDAKVNSTASALTAGQAVNKP
jgi:protease II